MRGVYLCGVKNQSSRRLRDQVVHEGSDLHHPTSLRFEPRRLAGYGLTLGSRFNFSSGSVSVATHLRYPSGSFRR